jgi:hypothetical protein
MTLRRVVIASPIEPSGASWILNCLLELGVAMHHRPTERNVWRAEGKMWVPDGDGVRLHPRAGVLQKWMPALARERFVFRGDVEIEYVQELPLAAGPPGERALLFVRDPRDAIWSAYKRQRPEMPFEAWIDLPHPRSLLARAAHWALFVRAWRARPGVATLRFEDYKRDDRATLEKALDHLAIEAGRADVERAALASTFEKAREGEARYREKHPGDAEVANRAGRVGDFRDRPELEAALASIEGRAGDLLHELGYAPGPAPRLASGGSGEGLGLPRLLAWYGQVALPPAVAEGARSRDPLSDPCVGALLSLARSLTADELSRAHLATHEARALTESLRELSAGVDGLARERLAGVHAAFAEGGAYHARQIGALLRARRGGSHG